MNPDPDLTGGCGLLLVIAFAVLVVLVVIAMSLMLGAWDGFLHAARLA